MSNENQIDIENWKAQIRKGYLDLCLLLIVSTRKRVYGLEILDILKDELKLPVKEGTLYPLLHRLSSDGLLSAKWETENNSSGHPRKFYIITPLGEDTVKSMQSEFEKLSQIYNQLKQGHSNHEN
jgi:PadR family transcriptional regulator PadR